MTFKKSSCGLREIGARLGAAALVEEASVVWETGAYRRPD